MRGKQMTAASLLAIGFLSGATYVAPHATYRPAPLCLHSEEAIFSCSIGTKLASVCGRNGRAVYRFGKPSRIELQARGLTTAEHGYSGGGETQITFGNNGYRYVIYDSVIRTAFGADVRHDPEFKTGVIVQKGGKLVSSVICGGSADASIGQNAAKYMPTGTFIEH